MGTLTKLDKFLDLMMLCPLHENFVYGLLVIKAEPIEFVCPFGIPVPPPPTIVTTAFLLIY